MICKKKLTIVIVAFESSRVIKDCLRNLDANKHDVVVVDNNSQDDTVKIVQENFPEVKIIKLEQNIGYGRANNVALEQVSTEFSLILNPDAIITQENIEKVLQALESHQDVAIAAPILLQKTPDRTETKEEQLKVIEFNLIQKHSDYMLVKYIIGAVMFLRMSIFREIGFFNKDIFLYYEDDEICFRAIKNGYNAAIIPSAQAFHFGHGSSSGGLRVVYKRFWHKTLSKLYWKVLQKSRLHATKSAIRITFTGFLKSFFYLIIFNVTKSVRNIASCLGALAFLVGLKAFDKNNNPRG